MGGPITSIIYIYFFIWLLCGSKIPSFSAWCLREKLHWKIDHDYIPFVRRLVDVTHYWRSRLFWNTRSIKSVFFQHAEVFLGTKHLSLNANDNDGCLSYSKSEAEASAKLFFRDKLLQCNKKYEKIHSRFSTFRSGRRKTFWISRFVPNKKGFGLHIV